MQCHPKCFLMTKSLCPFRFLLIALSGWMNQQRFQLIDYLSTPFFWLLAATIDAQRVLPGFAFPDNFTQFVNFFTE